MPLATLENFSVATSNSTAVHPDLACTGDTSRIPVIEPVMTEEQTLAKFQNFMEGLERLTLTQSGHPLAALTQILRRAAQEDSEAIQQVIKQAMKKKSGYWSRLFSQESWSEWSEDKTALGQVITILTDYMSSPFILKMFLKRLDKELLERANEEARLLLQTLSEKAEPSKKALPQLAFEKISDALMAIDTAVSLMLPLPPGALADEGTEEDLSEEKDPYQTISSDVLGKNTIESKDLAAAINAARQFAKNANKNFERKRRQKIAKAEHEQNMKEHDAAEAKFERAKRTYPPKGEEYYIDMGAYRIQKPALIQVLAWGDEERSTCEQVPLAVKGYFRWSIYKNEWGRDTLMDQDAYNYDIGREKPTVPEGSSDLLPNFCH